MKKIIIISSVVIFILLFVFIYRIFGIDLLIKINYETNIPVADKTIYQFEEDGRDGDSFRVIRLSDKKIKRIIWDKYDDPSLISELNYFFERNNISQEYYPEINDETLFYKKGFENSSKRDYLLMIYDSNKLVYIYEFHM